MGRLTAINKQSQHESAHVLHLSGLSQTAGWIGWLQLVRLLHNMVCTIVVVICLKFGAEDDVGQVTSHSVNNTVMQHATEWLRCECAAISPSTT